MRESRIRILRIIARMNVGGPARQISSLMQELPSENFQQLLVYGQCEENELDYLEANNLSVPGVRLSRLGRSVSLLGDLFAFVTIWWEIKKFRPDVVHTHTFKAGLLGRLATLTLFDRPVLMHTFHGHLLHGYFGSFKTKLVVFTERYLASKTDVLIAVGERVKLELLRHGIGTAPKYRVIPPGFNVCEAQKIDRKQLGLDDSDFICCWVGRLTDIKKPQRILDIANEFKKRGINRVKFLVVGDGELRENLEKEAISNSLQIKFVGWRHNSIDYIDLSDILILTSENEGTPIVIIEAQQLGKPVIATSVGSVSEVMVPEESGFVLEFSSQSFYQHISYLMDNPSVYQNFQTKARNFATLEFSTEKFISRYEKLYLDLVRS